MSIYPFDPDRILAKDRHHLLMQFRQHQQGRLGVEQKQVFERKVLTSQEAYLRRQSQVPDIQYPSELPVAEHVDRISDALEHHQVIVVAGETGSGKTTQLPKICLQAGRGVAGMIGHTQPRRLAARAVGSRLAEELGVDLGNEVGYQVRFAEQTTENTLIKVMTDGILLAETQRDRYLNRYDTIIIDEAHERSLNIDFLLGYLKRILPKRPDLKVIITSATIDVERFSDHFNDAPVISVSGRTFPVEVEYRPLIGEEADERDLSIQDGILAALDEIESLERKAKKNPGDVLIFLVGEREIRETAKILRQAELRDTEILPLYARLSHAEQRKIFQPHPGRRIVLATNVAETSLTVPGIRYVIDPGEARISRYSYRSKVQRLPVEAVSQASADQRKGRCGRTEPGICFRLYSEEDYLARPEYTEPEIRRTNLASVILQMMAYRLGDIEKFPFIQPPDRRFINDGYKLLQELGGVNDERKLTQTGKMLSRFPLDVRLARILLAGAEQHALRELLIIVSALGIQDPRERPHDKQQAADQAHAQWKDEQSEFLALINIWNAFEENRQALSSNQLRQYCKKNFLNYLRMREWRDTHRQLVLLCQEQKLVLNKEPGTYEQIHKALLYGLLSHIGRREEKQEYTGPRQRKFLVFPGSTLRRKSFPWIVAAEIVETSRLFARTIAQIEPQWIEQAASHLLKFSYLEPHWSRKRGETMAFAQVSLYGLVLVPKRPVSYAKIDPVLSREILIREALVEGDVRSRLQFIVENQKSREFVENLEAKTRRSDILVDDETLFSFYDDKLPADITNIRSLESWYRRLSDDEKKALVVDANTLMRQHLDANIDQQYPDNFQWKSQAFELDYQFQPGKKTDGITLKVPAAAVPQLPVGRLDWLVPGLLVEKCEALIRSLPKSLRRNFVPVPDFARKAASAMEASDESLPVALARQLRKMTGVTVPVEQWKPEAVPDHLKMNIQVVASEGKVLAEARDYHALLEKIENLPEVSTDGASSALFEESHGHTDWDFGDLSAELNVEQMGSRLHLYPYLEDHQYTVSVVASFDRNHAMSAHRSGVARLIMLALNESVRYILKNLPRKKEIGLLHAPQGKLDGLLDDLIMAAVIDLFIAGQPVVLTKAQFQSRCDAHRGEFVEHAFAWSERLFEILKAKHQLNKKLAGAVPLAQAMFMGDVKQQLQHLFSPGFLSRVSTATLEHYPRYLEAIVERLDKMPRNLPAEKEFARIIDPLWSQYMARAEKHRKEGVNDPELEAYRWMLEEFRVSYFAQRLGTAVSVSEKKLQKQWEKVQF